MLKEHCHFSHSLLCAVHSSTVQWKDPICFHKTISWNPSTRSSPPEMTLGISMKPQSCSARRLESKTCRDKQLAQLHDKSTVKTFRERHSDPGTASTHHPKLVRLKVCEELSVAEAIFPDFLQFNGNSERTVDDCGIAKTKYIDPKWSVDLINWYRREYGLLDKWITTAGVAMCLDFPQSLARRSNSEIK